MMNKIFITFWLLIASVCTNGQQAGFKFKRPITGITSAWHVVALPDDIYGKAQEDLNDLRIYGVKATGDTIEAPYVIQQIASDKLLSIPFSVINSVSNATGHYYTFQMQNDTAISEIQLNFLHRNFDWKISLEGSDDQQHWFSIINNYRVTAIENNDVRFRFSRIKFEPARYRFFRLFVPGDEDPKFQSAELFISKPTKQSFKTFIPSSINITQIKKDKVTTVLVTLGQAVPVSKLKVTVKEKFDFYRPVTIYNYIDSFNDPDYATLYQGLFNSVNNNSFEFNPALCRYIKIVIENYDNTPLTPDSITVSGVPVKLVVRFSEKADYFLAYGNNTISKPVYDLQNFIPSGSVEPIAVQLGEESAIKGATGAESIPLFKNKVWLWLTIALIIALLGWFTLKMLNNKEAEN